ncbi:hypothetical protein [Pseudomonas chlororaphis]|uniref:hypothetical protein n=1 Tax=Pseudomonas chlororaphis TaxID=587753 RepID=UPI001B3089B9|nr:hypothetical protein [Pseudomonas chlororaphis]MBP5054345.1 hypothetical protein [Pseudomonas chlororaphis]MBP5140283.1 hypothetical protein [Pseudomonas chlororaphis]QTT99522.1 hypothetical protein HUT26_09635 [Pseudomonas chlororaphis]
MTNLKNKRNATEQVTPEFLAAGRLYSQLHDAGLEKSPEAAEAFQRMYDAAPESFRQEMHDMAVQMGLMPSVPDGYTDDGEPVYSLEGLANRLGLSPEEARRAAEELGIGPSTTKANKVH